MTLGHEKLDVYQLSIGYGINENNEPYGKTDLDFDFDFDFDEKS